MVKTELYPVKRKIIEDDLNRLIISLKRGTIFLKRILFIRYRYNGDSIESASRKIDAIKMIDYK